MRLIRSFLREQLSGAVPLTERADDELRVLFEGRRASLRFVGHLPAHRGGGGLQFLELRAEARAGGTRELVLHHRNAWPDTPFAAHVSDGGWAKRVLVDDLDTLSFRYFGSPEEDSAPVWREDWSGAERLPALIELAVEPDAGPRWPAIVAAVRTRSAAGQPALVRIREPKPR
jgi:general secretion pathway protein J